MNGREDKNDNNLFFLCSLIEYIGRKTKNHRSVVVNAIGKEKLQHLFDLADVYHSENIDKITYDLVKQYKIEEKTFDNVANAKFSIPTHWDIGKVYKRLIIEVSTKQNKPLIDTLIEVYNSWISRKIEDFNSSVYYESPEYLYQSYLSGDVL
ncbi:MAG: hypothetical protein LBN27_00580 [Prevotellaceae bacterium]|jgi:siroheme synthase (precorrin-2 oxidase/ferrochelatase)|nr:hypothetical protein [Prevotellaceae bacterium]